MTVFEPSITRRRLLELLGAVAGSSFYPAFAAETDSIAPQPYFAGVNRALDALAKLGSPVLAEDAQQLSVLSRHNDSAAVDASEKILSRYTLLNLSINSDGSVQVTSGGATTTLIEQG